MLCSAQVHRTQLELIFTHFYLFIFSCLKHCSVLNCPRRHSKPMTPSFSSCNVANLASFQTPFQAASLNRVVLRNPWLLIYFIRIHQDAKGQIWSLNRASCLSTRVTFSDLYIDLNRQNKQTRSHASSDFCRAMGRTVFFDPLDRSRGCFLTQELMK